MTADDLRSLPGVGAATADDLVDAGFDTYRGLAVASPAELGRATGIGERAAADVIQAARDAADVGDFETGTALLERRERIGKLGWLVEDVDDLLGGGVETGSITELYGEFASGKSQVTHQLCANVQLPEEHGGLGGRAVFVDTEDTFRPERVDDVVRGLPDEAIRALLDRRNVDGDPDDPESLDALVESVLETVHVAKAFNSSHQILLAEKVRELAGEYADTDWPVRLVCVDSLTAHFRAEYVGRGELAERQQKLNEHLHDLMRIATLHDVAIVVTNQVAADPDSFFGDPTRPIGGNILGHNSTVRIYLRKAKNDKRIVRLVDAPNLPEGEVVLRITEDGLEPE